MVARWLTPVIFSSRNTQRRHKLLIFLLTTIPSNVLCYANIPPYFVVKRASLFTSKRYSDNELPMLMLMIVEIDAYPPTLLFCETFAYGLEGDGGDRWRRIFCQWDVSYTSIVLWVETIPIRRKQGREPLGVINVHNDRYHFN